MRRVVLPVLMLSLGPAAAGAETPWRVGQLYGATIEGRAVAFDALLKLRLRGSAVEAAALDACYARDELATLSDRVRLPLKAAGHRLDGAGTTELGRKNAALTLTLSGKADAMRATGTLTVDGTVIAIASEPFALADEEPPVLAERAEPDADDASLDDLTIFYRPESAGAVIAALRAGQAQLFPSGVLPSCGDLRSAQQGVGILVAPARREALRRRLAEIPGVTVRTDGWDRPGTMIRIPIGADGTPDEAALAATLAGAAEAATGGRRVAEPAHDPVTGVYAVEIRSPMEAAARLGLTQAVTLRYAIGKPGDGNGRYWHVQLKEVANRLVDESAAPLSLGTLDGLSSQEEDGLGIRKDVLARRVLERAAAAHGGQIRDPEAHAWQ